MLFSTSRPGLEFRGLEYVTVFCTTAVWFGVVLGAFAKLRKATISFVLSVCSSVRPHVIWVFFEKLRKVTISFVLSVCPSVSMLFEYFSKNCEKRLSASSCLSGRPHVIWVFFEKLRKATISFVLSVCPSVRPSACYLSIFRKRFVDTVQVSSKS